MAYSDYTLEKAIDRLGVQVVENKDLFAGVGEGTISDYLKTVFGFESAFSTNSEMARREMIIAPILNDVFSSKPQRFAVFSSENFDVDKKLELRGLADYLICLGTTKFIIQAPMIALAESKRNSPEDGLGQCIAELYAAALFNERKNKILPRLFGIATNGFDWLFGVYTVSDNVFTCDPVRYSLRELTRIIGILSYMRDEALRMYDISVKDKVE